MDALVSALDTSNSEKDISLPPTNARLPTLSSVGVLVCTYLLLNKACYALILVNE